MEVEIMKRSIIALILVSVFMLCLPACQIENTDDLIYTSLNVLAQAKTENYSICICVTAADGSSVKETYDVTTVEGVRSVAYAIETRNTFVIDSGVITAPEESVTITTGIYDETESAKADYDLPSLTFSDASVRNLVNREGLPPFGFSAEVVSTEKLIGKLINGTDIRIEGTYGLNTLETVTLSYKSLSGNSVTVTYTYR